MDSATFKRLIDMAGGTVNILRPDGGANFDVAMSSPKGVRDETLALEAKQNDEEVVFSFLDFEGEAFFKPRIGDRITDVDGDQYSIEQVKKMHGMARELYGWKCRIRG